MLNPIESPFDAFYALVIFSLLIYILAALTNHFKIKIEHSLFLYSYHTLFCLVYVWYSIIDVADASSYYRQSLGETQQFTLGTPGIVFLTHLFSYYLQVSYLGTFLVFNILGSIGFVAFFASLRAITEGKSAFHRQLPWVIILLPSVSFWSSAIGKDSLAFMAVGLTTWACLDLRRRLWLMGLAVLVMLVARPHIAGVMVIALAASLALDRRYRFSTRIMAALMSLPTAVILVPLALNYSGLGTDFEVGNVIDYIEERQGHNLSETAGIEPRAMSLPMQFVSYLFRPFPWEARSALQFAASLENIVLLAIFLLAAGGALRHRSAGYGEARVFLLLYAVGCLVVLAPLTANLGIAVRQKWMFLPCLFVLALSVAGRRRLPVLRVAKSVLPTEQAAATAYRQNQRALRS